MADLVKLPCGSEAVTVGVDDAKPGVYIAPCDASLIQRRPTPVPCPLCEGRMQVCSWPGPVARISTILGAHERTAATKAEIVPATLEVLGCPTCEVYFTRPKA